MVEKGQIEKLEPTQGKAFRFSPLIQRDDVSRGMLGDLVERVFDGSAEAVVLSLFDVKELNAEELTSLRKLLNKKMREAKS
jgi:BlaI family transcriptional regulator, penicillinase repressor